MSAIRSAPRQAAQLRASSPQVRVAGDFVAAERPHEHHALVDEVPGQVLEQVPRSRIAPVEVLEGDDRRPVHSEGTDQLECEHEQLADSSGARDRDVDEGLQCRRFWGAAQSLRVPDQVDQGCERDRVAADLDAATEVEACPGRARGFGQQGGLPDARVADDQQHPRLTVGCARDGTFEPHEFVFSSDDRMPGASVAHHMDYPPSTWVAPLAVASARELRCTAQCAQPGLRRTVRLVPPPTDRAKPCAPCTDPSGSRVSSLPPFSSPVAPESRSSGSDSATPPGIDFRDTATLAWSIELDADLPHALHGVSCNHTRGVRYQCTGTEQSGERRTMTIHVSRAGTSWQTIDATRRAAASSPLSNSAFTRRAMRHAIATSRRCQGCAAAEWMFRGDRKLGASRGLFVDRVRAGGTIAQVGRWSAASRPVRRILFGPKSAVTIHLGRRLPDGSCGLPGFNGRAVLTLLGLAPGGACRAARVTPGAGALLPHRFTLTCAPDPRTGRHRRSALCCAVLRVAPTGGYPAPCPVESGRSSNQSRWPAATRPTRCADQSKGSRNANVCVPKRVTFGVRSRRRA